MTAPPTGTIKFLSVLDTTASTRPRRHAAASAPHSAADCTPYALFTTWGTPRAWHSRATPTTSSAARGAKQLAVVSTHATAPAPTRATAAATAATSVTSWSPSSRMGTTSGSYPAAATHLRQVFWSMRGQTT
jgi:hypothetical protein